MSDEEVSRGDRQVRLAEERTRLAQERTVLAHIRTGFASFLFGTAVLGLFSTGPTQYAGYAFIGLGLAFLITSMVSYFQSKERARTVFRWRFAWNSDGQDDDQARD